MSGGPERHLLIGIAGVGNQVVIGTDDSVDINKVFWEGRLAGARVSHGPHSADNAGTARLLLDAVVAA